MRSRKVIYIFIICTFMCGCVNNKPSTIKHLDNNSKEVIEILDNDSSQFNTDFSCYEINNASNSHSINIQIISQNTDNSIVYKRDWEIDGDKAYLLTGINSNGNVYLSLLSGEKKQEEIIYNISFDFKSNHAYYDEIEQLEFFQNEHITLKALYYDDKNDSHMKANLSDYQNPKKIDETDHYLFWIITLK